jgi:prepilin-type N-terminal cleavage/methylation domain-containing protein
MSARTHKQSRSSSKGFTLIELLVVVAIIGLLASIVLSSLNTARQKGRDARRIADLKEIQTSLELFYSDHNGYPVSTSQATAATALSALVSGGYMSVVSDDPLGGGYHYVYISPAAPSGGTYAQKYCIGSILEGTAPSGVTGSCTNGLTLTGVQDAVNP